MIIHTWRQLIALYGSKNTLYVNSPLKAPFFRSYSNYTTSRAKIAIGALAAIANFISGKKVLLTRRSGYQNAHSVKAPPSPLRSDPSGVTSAPLFGVWEVSAPKNVRLMSLQKTRGIFVSP